MHNLDRGSEARVAVNMEQESAASIAMSRSGEA